MKKAATWLCALAVVGLTTSASAQYPYHPWHPPHPVTQGPVDISNMTHAQIHVDLFDSHGHEMSSIWLNPHQMTHIQCYATSSWSIELNDTGHRHSIGELQREGEASFSNGEWNVRIDHHF